jgi:hypothetical protein
MIVRECDGQLPILPPDANLPRPLGQSLEVGPSLTVGVRGAHLTMGPRGVRRTVGVPGTGIYYTSHSGYQSGVHSAHVETPIGPEQQQRAHNVGGLLALVVIVGTALIIGMAIGSANH